MTPMLRLAAFLLFGVVLRLCAQQPARVDLSISSPRLVAGDRTTLTAIARDNNGNALSNAVINWSSGNTAIATVDSQGVVTGRGLGSADLFARAGNVQAQARLTVLPLRIRMDPPGPLTVQVGEAVRFQAAALDANQQPLAAQPSQWQVFGANGGQINAARIDNNGQFRATGVAMVTVRATFNLGGSQVPQVWETVDVSIVPKLDYAVRRVLSSSDVRHSFQLQPFPPSGTMSVNDAGQIAVVVERALLQSESADSIRAAYVHRGHHRIPAAELVAQSHHLRRTGVQIHRGEHVPTPV